MHMSPKKRYADDLASGSLIADGAQAQAVEYLHDLYEVLVAGELRKTSFISSVKSLFAASKDAPVRGLYFWGGVGRGKTYLMDAFYDGLPVQRKMRIHFHRFMQQVHRDLKEFAGQKNPLLAVADKIAKSSRVLCFDEFFVSDIADAMILGGLLEALFDRDVTFIATSNVEPKNLYKNGLQRRRFLPSIELINRHTKVVNVDGGVDYRLKVLERAEIYHSPLGPRADKSLEQSFTQLAPDAQNISMGEVIEIDGRKIASVRCADDIIWFNFDALCDGPRSQNDYIELSRIYHAVLISNVPQLGEGREDAARRFVNMVDEFYDRNVKLIISAATPLDAIYVGRQLLFEFERTRSRLIEMQSMEYLSRGHRP